jgi:tRNA(Ile)-lysidine synthase
LKLVVAVSGGEDSHVLLHALRLFHRKGDVELVAAHLDHGLRDQSAQEAEFVLALADEYGLPVHAARAPALPSKENVEAWARNVRYAFLEEVRQSSGADFIVTAHHMNDQAETLLFRLITGRALSDTRGIAECDLSRRVIRPLLNVPKQEIEDYSCRHALRFVVDGSNFDQARTRNRIRQDLLPRLLQDYNPQAIAALAGLSARLAEDERALDAAAARAAAEPLLLLHREQPALAWRVLAEQAAAQLGERAQRLGYKAYKEILSLLATTRSRNRRIDVGQGICCDIGADGRVRFFCVTERDGEVESAQVLPVALPVPGFVERQYSDGSAVSMRAGVVVVHDELRADFPGLLDWTKARVRNNDPYCSAVEYFDLEQLTGTGLSVRERRDGDRMRIWRRGGRKLKKLFHDCELPLRLRDKMPLVQAGDDILWVPGLARGEAAPVSPDSRYLLELQYHRHLFLS